MNNTVVLDGRKIIYLKCQARHFTYSLKFTLITLSEEAGTGKMYIYLLWLFIVYCTTHWH